MIDLEKEFRTLKLLASALIIIGTGLTIGGFGAAFFFSDEKRPAPPKITSPEEAANPDSDAAPPPPPKDYKARFSSSLRSMSIPSGALGVIFLICGIVLRFIIRNNIDEKDETEPSPELFKAYAEQLVIAERQREKDKQRKRMK